MVQKPLQSVPTPMVVDEPSTETAEADGDKSMDARKAFWAKYKRPAGVPPVDAKDELLSKPTLILGQDDPEVTPPPSQVLAEPGPAPVAEPPKAMSEPSAVEKQVLPEPSPAPEPLPAEMSSVPCAQLALPVDACAAVVEPPDNPILMRFLKMDDLQLLAEIAKAKAHPQFRAFQGAHGVLESDFGGLEPVDELAFFYEWVAGDGAAKTSEDVKAVGTNEPQVAQQPEATATAPTVLEPKPAATTEASETGPATTSGETTAVTTKPATPAVVTTPAETAAPAAVTTPAVTAAPAAVTTPAETAAPAAVTTPAVTAAPVPPVPAQPAKEMETMPPPAVPAGRARDSGVSEALKRLTTVDLDNGSRPPQTLAQHGNQPVPCLTVVIMELNGTPQPVSLPLSPEQCIAAGLKLANPPHGADDGASSHDHHGTGKGSTADDNKLDIEMDETPKEGDKAICGL